MAVSSSEQWTVSLLGATVVCCVMLPLLTWGDLLFYPTLKPSAARKIKRDVVAMSLTEQREIVTIGEKSRGKSAIRPWLPSSQLGCIPREYIVAVVCRFVE